jgi:alpha 1,2-mannosyltransferase
MSKRRRLLVVAMLLIAMVTLQRFLAAPTDVAAAPTAAPDSADAETRAPLRTKGGATRSFAPLTRRPARNGERRLKGVILFLYGGRWHRYFVEHCLPRLQRYMLACHPYPVHVFHEGIGAGERRTIAAAIPGATRTDFEDVSAFWKTLPNGVSEAQFNAWRSAGVQAKFQGRGYRVMCRFWAGLAWTLPSMDRYDYYWRLDTDSLLTRPVATDPFRHVFVERGCEYAFNRLKGEAPDVATKMWDTFLAWSKHAELAPRRLAAVRRFAVSNATGLFTRPMFYNNFELGTFRLKRSAVYQSFFRYVDERQPFGIFRYRWGDAPLHSLGVVAELAGDRMCNVSQAVVGYRHAVKRPGEMPDLSCTAE